jgi:hypothetical protein
MAKEQNLALNSAKISGACGRLMCCLRYEYDTYQEESRRTPKVDSRVITPDGPGKVTEAKPLLGLVKVALDETPADQKIYDRELLRPETEDEYKDALEKKALREKKEAERAEAKIAAAARVAEAKEAALARASADKNDKIKERAQKNAQRHSQRQAAFHERKNAEQSVVQDAQTSSPVKNESAQGEGNKQNHKNRHGRPHHRRPKTHADAQKGQNNKSE